MRKCETYQPQRELTTPVALSTPLSSQRDDLCSGSSTFTVTSYCESVEVASTWVVQSSHTLDRPKKKYVCFLSHAQIEKLGSVGR